MKFVLSVAAVAGAFALVLLGGGAVTGVWDELELPRASEAADRASQASKGKRATEKAAAKERRAKARAKARRAATKRWVRSVNKICRSAKSEAAGMTKPRSLAEAEAYVARLAELSARYNARVAAIPPPPGQRAKIARLKRLFTKDDVLLARLQDAVRARNAAKVADLGERVDAIAERERQILYDLGALDCAL